MCTRRIRLVTTSCRGESRDGTNPFTSTFSIDGAASDPSCNRVRSRNAVRSQSTPTSVGVSAREGIGGVCLFGEFLYRSEAAVPAVGNLGQGAGCFGEALFADLVANFASLTVRVYQSDSLQDREMFGYRLATDRHVRGERRRRGLTAGNEEIEQFAASRIGHRFPEIVVLVLVAHRDD
jgi:hypothetical protein